MQHEIQLEIYGSLHIQHRIQNIKNKINENKNKTENQINEIKNELEEMKNERELFQYRFANTPEFMSIINAEDADSN